MRFEIARIDHDRLALSAPAREAIHHRDKDPLVAPSLPPVAERLCRTIFPQRIPPLQTVAIDENNAVQHPLIIHPPIIHPQSAMTSGKEALKPCHLLVRQPIQLAHDQSPRRARIRSRHPDQWVLTLARTQPVTADSGFPENGRSFSGSFPTIAGPLADRQL